MHQEEESSSFLKVQELLQLVVIRKEASDALTRLRAQDDANPKRSPLKQNKNDSSESDSLKTPIRISTVRSTPTHSAANCPPTQLFSGSNIESPPIAIAQLQQLQPSPSSARSRPAYASASKASDAVPLDEAIVLVWADYIEKRSIPRDAPSIPLSLNIGVPVPPGFETHYKVAAFALAKSRRSQNK